MHFPILALVSCGKRRFCSNMGIVAIFIRIVFYNQPDFPFIIIHQFFDSRTDSHPWKAFRGIGLAARFLGTFYGREGGKRAAIAAVLAE